MAFGETVLGSILTDFIHGTLDGLNKKNVRKDYRSIAKQSNHGVCQFPVIASRTLDYDTISIINKACERNFCSFLQVVLQMNQVMGEDETVVDFVRRFHTNSSDIEGHFTEAVNIIQKELLYQNTIFESMFNVAPINNKVFDAREIFLLEANRNKGKNKNKNKNQNNNNGSNSSGNNGQNNGNNNSNKNTNNQKNKNKTRTRTIIKRETKPAINNYVGDLVPRDSLMDNDIKKSNELVPSLLHVKVKQSLSTGVTAVDFILGVKATIHPVTANDMIHNLTKVALKKSDFFNFLRWTTGEISLIKDIILGLNEAKDNLRDQYDKKASSWWNLLRNEKTIRRYNKWSRQTPILPNATIVISQEERDYLKANIKYDLLDESTARKFIQELGLLQLVVVDVSTELAHFMIDGQSHFQVYTFSALERENGNSEKQFKNILKAVNKL